MTNRSRTGESRRSAPRILALDLMSRLGWAFRANDGSLHYGTETFKLKGIESTGMRFMRFRDWLDEIVVEVVKPEAIFFEQFVGFPRKNMGAIRRSITASPRISRVGGCLWLNR